MSSTAAQNETSAAITVTYFPGLYGTHAPQYMDIHEPLNWIRDGKLKEQITALRAEVDPVKWEKRKDALPIVCFSGTFTVRNEASMVEHSGLLILDFDKIPADAMANERARIQADPHTFALFTSPSGKGLKALVKVATDKEGHRLAYAAVLKHYGSTYADKGTNDPVRACYLCWDPDLYVNEEAEVFIPPPPLKVVDGIPDEELAEIAGRAFSQVFPTKTAQSPVPSFPLEVLPELLGDYARQLQQVNGFLPDYTAAGMLFAASTAIGNAVRLKVNETYTAPGILWLVLVGRPSIGKTHPLNTMVKPLAKRDARTKREHSEAVAIWEAEQEERRKRKGGKDATTEGPPLPRPVWRPLIYDDITTEALVAKQAASPRGGGLHCDELAGWLARMDQYRKGGDRQKWLTIFNGSQLTEIRKTAGEHVVPRPFVSVAGGVQPAKLSNLGRDDDGLLHRLLFVYPDVQVRRYASSASVDKQWGEIWDKVLDQLLSLEMRNEDGELVPVLLEHSQGAAEVFAVWDRMNVDRTNASSDDLSAGLFGKLDTYAQRLALVLEMLHRACTGEGHEREVRREAMEGALKLLEYFEATARKVHFQLFEADAVDRLPPLKGRVYAALPERCATGDGIKIAEKMGMPPTTFKRMLRDTKLFRKDGHGVNLKLMDA